MLHLPLRPDLPLYSRKIPIDKSQGLENILGSHLLASYTGVDCGGVLDGGEDVSSIALDFAESVLSAAIPAIEVVAARLTADRGVGNELVAVDHVNADPVIVGARKQAHIHLRHIMMALVSWHVRVQSMAAKDRI